MNWLDRFIIPNELFSVELLSDNNEEFNESSSIIDDDWSFVPITISSELLPRMASASSNDEPLMPHCILNLVYVDLHELVKLKGHHVKDRDVDDD